MRYLRLPTKLETGEKLPVLPRERLPRMLLSQVRNSGPRFRPDASGYAQTNDSAAKGTTKQVQLRSGGMVTLVIDAAVFSIQGEDRDFVFELIDRIRKYGELRPREGQTWAQSRNSRAKNKASGAHMMNRRRLDA